MPTGNQLARLKPHLPIFDPTLPASRRNQTKEVSLACEVLLSLLYPFAWTGIYIPLLPFVYAMRIAPASAFVIGLERGFLRHIDTGRVRACLLLDLDRNSVTSTSDEPTDTMLPKTVYTFLVRALVTADSDGDGDAGDDAGRSDAGTSSTAEGRRPAAASSVWAALDHRGCAAIAGSFPYSNVY